MKLKVGDWLTTKEDPTYRSQYLMLNQGALLTWYSENLCRTQNVVCSIWSGISVIHCFDPVIDPKEIILRS
ncbi:TPA: hypothetical protein MH561_17870 [Klebsiella pneumoniae]|nr:hypothetical protein [Klebsiella variicola]HBX5814840.1 hypothetical protein [Klebsiella pneumoniae]